MNNSATSPPIWTAEAPFESWRQGESETYKANNPAQIYWNVRTLWTSVWTDTNTWITLQPLSWFGWQRHHWKAGNEEDLIHTKQIVWCKYIEMFEHFEQVFEQLPNIPTSLKNVWTVFQPIWKVFKHCSNRSKKCLNTVLTSLTSVWTDLKSVWTLFQPVWQVFEQCSNWSEKCSTTA